MQEDNEEGSSDSDSLEIRRNEPGNEDRSENGRFVF
jgi:hypothetical protein